MKTRLLIIVFTILFSSMLVNNAYGSIYLDKAVYTWTDKINIRITEHGIDSDKSSVKIFTDKNELNNYKLSKAGNGLYTGEIILTGFLHDVTGDGKPDTNPRTAGNGPNNGFLESGRDETFTITVEFGDGDTISKSAKINWNEGNIVLDKSNYFLNESAKIQVTDADMNLNPETLDKTIIHVFSDSDKAGIIIDAIETEEESGLFETTVSFTREQASSGNRLFVVPGDGIYAQYDDYTLPEPFRITDNLEIIAESALLVDSPIPEPEQDLPLYENCGPGTTFQNGICVVEDVVIKNSSGIWGSVIEYSVLSPIKQFKSGVTIEEIQCKENFVLIQKYDDKPVCVKPETQLKLIERGWTKIVSDKKDILLDRFKDKPEVSAFFAKYEGAKVSVRDDYVSYFAGNEDDFLVRMNLYFDENYELDYMDFHCYVEREHQDDVAQSFILKYLEKYDCKK